MHSNLKFRPHELVIAQELLEREHKTRVACCEDILENIPANAVLINSDEDHFHQTGFNDKQNFCYWSESNPKELHKRPIHSELCSCKFWSLGHLLL